MVARATAIYQIYGLNNMVPFLVGIMEKIPNKFDFNGRFKNFDTDDPNPSDIDPKILIYFPTFTQLTYFKLHNGLVQGNRLHFNYNRFVYDIYMGI